MDAQALSTYPFPEMIDLLDATPIQQSTMDVNSSNAAAPHTSTLQLQTLIQWDAAAAAAATPLALDDGIDRAAVDSVAPKSAAIQGWPYICSFPCRVYVIPKCNYNIHNYDITEHELTMFFTHIKQWPRFATGMQLPTDSPLAIFLAKLQNHCYIKLLMIASRHIPRSKYIHKIKCLNLRELALYNMRYPPITPWICPNSASV